MKGYRKRNESERCEKVKLQNIWNENSMIISFKVMSIIRTAKPSQWISQAHQRPHTRSCVFINYTSSSRNDANSVCTLVFAVKTNKQCRKYAMCCLKSMASVTVAALYDGIVFDSHGKMEYAWWLTKQCVHNKQKNRALFQPFAFALHTFRE